ncbi:sulfatase [Cyclobacterium sp. 1_MG-2023]|uniref:sulfatase n=1 Tax=Cyclobacterium sp. 1_MG-2023 TaxID=3062681 RepID=UPI0026E33261|nr:sulfatase [Cyclobacterium sp. 1_MG-2023]MDO6439010.1 sulfatase [Cyclobacterium sp. 1_MG-2023]
MSQKYLLLFLISFCLSSTIVKSQQELPNVLMIAVDDLNNFVGGMGHPDALTPNMDKLIKKGLLFTNAQCQSPMCSPSRTAIMTGLRPSTTGIYGFIDDNDIKETNKATQDAKMMHQYFKEHGYYTMGIGKIYHNHAPKDIFDESGGRAKGFGPYAAQNFHWDKKRTSTDWGPFPAEDKQMPDYHTAEWAAERLNRTYDQPFFLSVGFLRPHVPWYVPQKWFDLYDTAKLTLPPYLKTDREDLPPIALEIDDLPMMPTTEWALANGQWKNILQGYLASVSFVDHYIGKVLNALEQSPHAKNTIVVLWSDHGYRLGEKNTFAKVALWNSATAAPLIYAGPDIPKGEKVETPVELFSIYPTLAELAKLPKPKNIEAESIYPLVKDPKLNWDKPAIVTWARNNHAIVTKEYRYIHYEDGAEELYAVEKDPNEWYNLADRQGYEGIKKRLAQYLPKTNVKWAKASKYDNNEYFINQKIEQSE